MDAMKFKGCILAVTLASLTACAELPKKDQNLSVDTHAERGHLSVDQDAARPTIPSPIETVPLPPAPLAKNTPDQLFTVVVTNVPIKELLFTLARDAKSNIDVHDNIEGNITLNALDQTLDQILHRIQGQAAIRYQIDPGFIRVEADLPYLKQYEIDYPNMSRKTTTNVTIATEVATTGGGAVGGSSNDAGNMSSTTIENSSNNQFWETLVSSVDAIIYEPQAKKDKEPSDTEADATSSAAPTTASDDADDADDGPNKNIIANPETGMLTVRATQKQHGDLQRYLDKLMASARRQVLIEATVVEVTLSDAYQAGIDWNKVGSNGEGFSVNQSLTGGNLASAPVLSINYTNLVRGVTDVTSTIKLLNEFGNTRVLSSPKLMVLNNQTALLKVVDNRVYFTTEVDIQLGQNGSGNITTFETEIHTVPVGFVMSVTPQISREGSVTLNARPTLSRILRFVSDPNPALAAQGVTNLIPEIQVREVESILNIQSGNIGIIGGLIQDEVKESTAGVPLLAKLPGVGDLFSYRNDDTTKSELVVFLRPVVIKAASVNRDLQKFQRYLK